MALTAEQQYRLERLRDPDPRVRVRALSALVERPDAAPEIVAAVEGLLDDRTPVITQIPFRYGEVRGVAAEAAAALRFALKREDPVVLDPYYPTVTPEKLGELSRAAGVNEPLGDALARYAWLRDHGHLPGKRREFHPVAYGPL